MSQPAVSFDEEDQTQEERQTSSEETICCDPGVRGEEMMSSSFINPKDVLIEGDPRVIAADEVWMECMSEEGYEYADQDEIIEEYEEMYDALTDGEDPEELTGADLEALQELQAEEIAVALKDLECQGPLDEVLREVEIEIYREPVSG